MPVRCRFRFRDSEAHKKLSVKKPDWQAFLRFCYQRKSDRNTYLQVSQIRARIPRTKEFPRPLSTDLILGEVLRINPEAARLLVNVAWCYDTVPYDLQTFLLVKMGVTSDHISGMLKKAREVSAHVS